MQRLRNLVERVGGFHLRAGSMQRAQRRIASLLAAGGEIPRREIDVYVAETHRYFSAFEREAHGHLKDLEKRLEHVGQLQFNLTAERGVAARRVEITQGVLADLDALAESSPE
jgi:hypothetical protein